MIDEAIRNEMALIMQQINYEEAADFGYDHKRVRQLWDKYHRLNELLNDKESVEK